MTGLLALSRLEVRRATRNRRVIFFSVLYPAVLYLAIGSGAHWTANGIPGKTYMLLSMASFGALSAALTTTAQKIAQERKDGWTRQLRLTALPGNGYVIAKLASTMVVVIPAIVIVFICGDATGVRLSTGRWLGAFAVLWLGSLAFTALGVAVGYGVPNDSVQLVVIILYIGFSFIGGLWFPLSGVMADVGKATPTYQVRELSTNIVTGAHVPMSAIFVLIAWMVGAGVLASVLYRRGVTVD